MKNSNDTIGNRTRDLPACSAVKCTPVHKFLFLRDWRAVACVSWNASSETLGAASPWKEKFQTNSVLVIHVENKHPLLPEGHVFLESCGRDGAVVVGRN